MPQGRTKEYVEEGRLVKEWPNNDPPVKTTECITEECIRDAVEKRRCSCDSCVSERVSKAESIDPEVESDGWSLRELREELPDQLYHEVMEHFEDGEFGVEPEEDEELDEDVTKQVIEAALVDYDPGNFLVQDHNDGVLAIDLAEDEPVALEQFYARVEEDGR